MVQEAFLKIWHNRKTLKPDLSFQAYLFTIAYRMISEHFRKNFREKAHLHEIIENFIAVDDKLNEQLNYQSSLDLVEKLIAKLPPRQKEILIYRKIEGRSVIEISQKLGIAVKTVEHHLTDAIKTLKKGLSRQDIY